MGVYLDGKTLYEGRVLTIQSHYWLDGMLEEWAVCWNSEKQETESITFGYYGIDGSNLARGSAEIDATPEIWHEVLRSFRADANKAFSDSVVRFKREMHKGTHAEVVRGKKVPKGTMLEVFWVGEKPTYRSRHYSWMDETETICGCYDEHGEKVWIKAEYLKNRDDIKSPNAKERRKFIKEYMENRARQLGYYAS